MAFALAAALPALGQTRIDEDLALKRVSARQGLAIDGLKVLETAQARYPHSGRTATAFKVADGEGTVFGVAFDERGREVDTDELVLLEEQARVAKYGKLDQALFESIRLADAAQRFPVAIWVHERGEKTLQRPMPDEIPLLLPTDEALTQFLDDVAVRRSEAVQGFIAPVVERLDAADIGYTLNELAPVIYATLSADEIRLVDRLEEVERIYPAPPVDATLDVARQTIRADVVETSGISGNGIRAAEVEVGGRIAAGNPYLAGVTQDGTFVCSGASNHSTYVAGILRSTHASARGIAPGMTLWAGGSCNGFESQLTSQSTTASTWGALAYNCSFGRNDALVVGSMDRYYDGLVLNSFRTVVVAAGNEGPGYATPGGGIVGGNVGSPATAFNIITVGSFDDRNTTSWTGDVMSFFTSFRDPLSTHSDREKPEIAAPGSGIVSTTTAFPWTGTYGSASGTSYAAPMVMGTVVQMMERDSVLRIWPEINKAILMTSAIHDIEAPTRLSEKEGAGSLVASQADLLVRRLVGNWNGIGYSCSNGLDTTVATMSLTAGRRLRAVICWDNDPAYASYSTQPCADLDLQVKNASGSIVAGSSSWDNTYEIVDFTVPATGNYTLNVRKFRCDLSPQFLGWSWMQP